MLKVGRSAYHYANPLSQSHRVVSVQYEHLEFWVISLTSRLRSDKLASPDRARTRLQKRWNRSTKWTQTKSMKLCYPRPTDKSHDRSCYRFVWLCEGRLLSTLDRFFLLSLISLSFYRFYFLSFLSFVFIFYLFIRSFSWLIYSFAHPAHWFIYWKIILVN